MSKKIYFVDQKLTFNNDYTGPKNFVGFIANSGAVLRPTYFDLDNEEAKSLCQIMKCNSASELDGQVVTTVVKLIYGSLDVTPIIVAVGKDGSFVQRHWHGKYDKDDWFCRLFTENPEVKIEQEEDLIKNEYKDYKIERIPFKEKTYRGR